MGKRVLVTGGAGFIGSHLTDHLLAEGHSVRILDNLDPQVHGPDAERPLYLDPDAELVVGDVRDIAAVKAALEGIDAVFHFASAVGVGQSMYDIARYTSVNNLGTAVLLEALTEHRVQKLVVASSMSLYGEGLYAGPDGQTAAGCDRSIDQLKRGEWEVVDETGNQLTPVATPETKPPAVNSVYALNKYDQERMSLIVGRAYGIPTVALRFFNVFGTRQSLSNPYTGVLAIFASRLLNNNPPQIFEDGNQLRDFVSVHDIARACLLAMDAPEAQFGVFNIGSGRAVTIREVAEAVALALDKTNIEPQITRSYRVGDVRHCFADITLAQEVLGYEPLGSLQADVYDLGQWLARQTAEDRVEAASAELAARGLVI